MFALDYSPGNRDPQLAASALSNLRIGVGWLGSSHEERVASPQFLPLGARCTRPQAPQHLAWTTHSVFSSHGTRDWSQRLFQPVRLRSRPVRLQGTSVSIFSRHGQMPATGLSNVTSLTPCVRARCSQVTAITLRSCEFSSRGSGRRPYSPSCIGQCEYGLRPKKPDDTVSLGRCPRLRWEQAFGQAPTDCEMRDFKAVSRAVPRPLRRPRLPASAGSSGRAALAGRSARRPRCPSGGPRAAGGLSASPRRSSPQRRRPRRWG